jgi:ureidoacrylate peracid hydrolase
VLADATHQAGPESLHRAALANIETFFGWVSDVAALESALGVPSRAPVGADLAG